MRLKISFETPEQREILSKQLAESFSADYEVEREGEKMLQLVIQPHLFREISDIVRKEKQIYANVTVEI